MSAAKPARRSCIRAQAAARKARYALFLGPDEVNSGLAKLKLLSTGEERTLELEAFFRPQTLRELLP